MKSLKQYLNELLVSRKITKSNCVSIQPDFFDALDKTKQEIQYEISCCLMF
jgi:hypothetical protein